MSNLPRGVRIDRGYVQVRIMYHGRYYYKNFGEDSPMARHVASIHAAEKYKEILLGKAGIGKEAVRIKFKDARPLFYQRHYANYRDPVTNKPRSEKSIQSAQSLLDVVGQEFDEFYLDDIEVSDLRRYQERRLGVDKVQPATFNKEKGIISSLYTQLQRWIAEKLIDPIRLPEKNPCEFIQRMQENERERVPDTWELAAAYTWCQTNDPGLWDAIEKALLTALRKGDLVALDGSLTVKGIQQKTGEKFDLPITLEKPADFVNWRRRWHALRVAMGWLKGSPKHTTWHDLRHWAPTLLGEQGFSIKIIQNYTGHSQEKSAERYTNVRRKALEPAVDVVKRELQRIRDEGNV